MAPKRVEIGEYPLEDGKMTEVPFPNKDSESKILLSKIDGKYYATSNKCTHYGAPLVKGVLTCAGRLVCPWHGAAFSVCTGDVEDAPGINHLKSYKVDSDANGKLFVTAPTEEKEVEATREPELVRALERNKGDVYEKGVVVIGGGAGAAHAVEGLREQGFEGRIRVLSSENHLPIDRTKISKALITDASQIAIRPQSFYDKLGVEFLLGKEADKIDFENNVVLLKNGDKVEYDQLIVATGSVPNKIPVNGADLGNIFLMRTVNDAQEIMNVLGSEEEAKGKKVVVIGSSFIGMEAALAAGGKGAEVTVVGMDEVPFEAILGKTVGQGMRKAHEKKGTKFFLPASLDLFEPSKSDSSKVGSVKLKDGQSIEADLVIMGVGVKPATSVLKNSGVELEKDGSVKTDEFLRIGGESLVKGNVFAIGDIASYLDVKTGDNVRVEHWNVASNHARSVASTIMQKGAAFEKIAVFWSAQAGGQLRYCGNTRSKQWKDDIVQGDPAEGKFVAYYTIGDEVVAVASMGSDPIAAHCSELFRLEKMLSASDIKSGKSPLDVELK